MDPSIVDGLSMMIIKDINRAISWKSSQRELYISLVPRVPRDFIPPCGGEPFDPRVGLGPPELLKRIIYMIKKETGLYATWKHLNKEEMYLVVTLYNRK